MATISNVYHHKYEKAIEKVPINPKYETRQYIRGGFLFFLGGIHTEYKKEMVSCDGYEEVEYCNVCGCGREHKAHHLVMRADTFN